MSRANASRHVELFAEFTALPGREEEVEHLLLALTAEVRRESGCLGFAPYRVAAAPDGASVTAGPAPVGTRFVVTEAYRDADAFAEHLASGHGASFNASLLPLIEESASVLTFLRPLA